MLNTPVQTGADGTRLIEGVPRGNLLIHAQKDFPDPPPGGIREGDSCYIPADLGATPDSPTWPELRRVDCQDPLIFPDGDQVVTEVRVVLELPSAERRHVVFNGNVHVSSCTCGDPGPPETNDPDLLQFCDVTKIEPDASAHVDNQNQCIDDVGLDWSARSLFG